MKKKDGIVIAIVLIIAGVLSVGMYGEQGTTGDTVRIMIGADVYGTYPLMMEQVIQIENTYGYNCVVIENGQVFMKEADCPDGYCVAHKAISKTNETIVCLPHKLVVEIYGSVDDGIDSVAQ